MGDLDVRITVDASNLVAAFLKLLHAMTVWIDFQQLPRDIRRYASRAIRDGWPRPEAVALAQTWPPGTRWLAPIPVYRGEPRVGVR